MKKLYTFVLILFVFTSIVLACRFTVREIGFADFGTDEYKLVFFKDKNSTLEQTELFEKIAYAALLDANVKSQITDVGQPDHPLLKWYSGSNPDKQKLALFSPTGEALHLELDRTAANFREEIWDLLEDVLTSSTRENILEKIVQYYGVVLLVSGPDETANQAALKMVNDAVEEIKVMMASMPKPVNQPPQIFVVNYEDLDSERVLLWSLGIEEVGDVLPAITVLYGRGRQMGRLLPANIIKANIVRNLLAFVGADCECGLDRSWILGRMIPTRWEASLQTKVIDVHKFDAENPLIKAEMSQILSISPNKARTQSNSTLSLEGIYGYTEKEIDLVNTSTTAANRDNPGMSSILKKSLLISGLTLLVLLLFGTIILIKKRKE